MNFSDYIKCGKILFYNEVSERDDNDGGSGFTAKKNIVAFVKDEIYIITYSIGLPIR